MMAKAEAGIYEAMMAEPAAEYCAPSVLWERLELRSRIGDDGYNVRLTLCDIRWNSKSRRTQQSEKDKLREHCCGSSMAQGSK